LTEAKQYKAKLEALHGQAKTTRIASRIRYRKLADRRSRSQRWRDAVAELLTLQGDYQRWLEALPENLADGSTAEALRVICGLDLLELESVEPPRGFGRD